MIVEIPIRSDLDWYSLTAALDGADYRLAIWWNTRDERWYLSVSESDGTLIVAGVPMVVDYPLLDRFAHEDLPTGVLMALDTSGEGAEAGQEDLGDRVRLIYVPEGVL